MIDPEDVEAVRKYITQWHQQRTVMSDEGKPLLGEKYEQELCEREMEKVNWFVMWSRKAGVLR